jgi:hypothetical protein
MLNTCYFALKYRLILICEDELPGGQSLFSRIRLMESSVKSGREPLCFIFCKKIDAKLSRL